MSNVASLARAREARKNQETPHHGGKGYALLHRKIKELPFYRTDSEAVHLWIHIILSANHAPASVNTELGEILVNRGEFITGRNTLASETGITGDRIKYLLNKFEKLSMISRISNKKFTRVSVTKYDDYQPNFVPTDYQQSANAMPLTPRASEEVVPTDCHQSATNNELLTNNSISKDIECATSASKQADQKQRLSCEEVWEALRECVPDARGWNVLTPKRRQLIQKFWREARPIAKQFGDDQPFGMEAFRQYLNYLHASCRWMFETRSDQATGKTWQKRNYEYILSAELYAQVREGERDDR
ncbi:DNA replication protein [Pantoea sp. ACRSH]|uniref:DNA replication protein n=1 Tax=unclassified Pantoea TaxID=2630326 RepID=UPI001EF4574C|nr:MULTISPECIES: DNA replication protein [unclassified Pantoea]MCG7368032.1 DNA replication protein [Pantoea sp. ACRSH]MCG7398391.1 DNA replication protein [Pantoea sp. ACRSC]